MALKRAGNPVGSSFPMYTLHMANQDGYLDDFLDNIVLILTVFFSTNDDFVGNLEFSR